MNFTKILQNLKTLDELTRTMIPCDEYEELTKAQILTKINEIRIEVEKQGTL